MLENKRDLAVEIFDKLEVRGLIGYDIETLKEEAVDVIEEVLKQYLLIEGNVLD